MPSSFLADAEPVGGCGQHLDGSPTVKGASSSTAPQLASDVAEDLSSHNEQGIEDGGSSVSGVTAPSSQAALTAGSGDFSQFGEVGVAQAVPGDPGPGAAGLPHRGLAAKGETKLKQLAHLLPHSLSRTQYDELKEPPDSSEAGHHRPAPKAPSWSEPHHGPGPGLLAADAGARAPSSPNPKRGIEGMMGGLGRKRYSELVDVQGPQVSAVSDTKSTDSAPSASRSSTDTAPSSLFSPGRLLRSFGRSNSAQAARHLEEGGHHRSRGESDSSASGVVDDCSEDMLAESAPQNDKGVMEVVSRSLFRKGGRHSRHSSIDPLADKL